MLALWQYWVKLQIVRDPVLVVMQIVTNDPLSIYQRILSRANLFQYLPVMQSLYCDET
jgi:hypothetical protein